MPSCTHRACRVLHESGVCTLLNQQNATRRAVSRIPIATTANYSIASTLRPSPSSLGHRNHDHPTNASRDGTPPQQGVRRRFFHDYFVTHIPSSSLHPDQRSAAGPGHRLPRDASKPHTSGKSDPTPAPAHVHSTHGGVNRDTTVVRIPLRSAKHHFGAAMSRGSRPYNEDAFQAGVVEIPAFAKRAPISLTRAPASSPLAEYRRRQAQGQLQGRQGDQSRKEQGNGGDGGAEPKPNDGATTPSGDPQVFYFGVFDGHGGDQCSHFLQDSLHGYVENAAKDFGLQSSLKNTPGPGNRTQGGGRPGETQTPDRPATAKVTDPKRPESGSKDNSEPPKSQPAAEQGVDQEKALGLEKELLRMWRTRVGGYFRRLQPELFYDREDNSQSGKDISTILTYAFLQADLDFVSAQALKPTETTENDPVVSDQAINNVETLDDPIAQIGGAKRFEGGSTCSVALVSTPTPTPFWHPSTPSTLVTAHVGDTRILLCQTKDGLAVPITSNHHPSNPVEERRLRRFSGQFSTDSFGEERISGLANTRAFGDMRSKRVGVSAEPEVTRIEMAAAEYSFLVLMSDGISGTLSDQEVVDIVKEAKTPEAGARDVVAFATEVSQEGDNATCLVVRLGGWERRGEGGVGSLGTKEARDWRREEAVDPRSRRQ